MSDIEKKAVSLLVDALNSVAVSKNDNVNNALADRLSKGAKNWAIRKMNINNYCSNTYHLKSIIKPSSKQWKEPPVEDAILLKMRERIRKGERLLERIAGVKTEVLASLVNMERENYLSKVDPTRRDIFKKEFASGDDAIKANAITSAISEKFSDFIIKIPSAVKTNPSPLEYSSRANWKNPSFSKYYTARIRNLINAIKNNDRSLFLDRLKKGELKISKIPDYEIWDIWYKEPKPEDPLPPRAEDMPDGMFKCKNCKSYKTTYVEKQTRSADEPMTIFITCMLCGNVTKI
jgi:DNA-directed RNA polymerase subunit M/transcription elongation factor TFIIS